MVRPQVRHPALSWVKSITIHHHWLPHCIYNPCVAYQWSWNSLRLGSAERKLGHTHTHTLPPSRGEGRGEIWRSCGELLLLFGLHLLTHVGHPSNHAQLLIARATHEAYRLQKAALQSISAVEGRSWSSVHDVLVLQRHVFLVILKSFGRLTGGMFNTGSAFQ